MLSGGDLFAVKRLMKELAIRLAECYQVMKSEFTLELRVPTLERRKQQRQEEEDTVPLATVPLLFFFLNPQGGMEETGCAADIC